MANNTNKTAAENEELEQLKALLAEKEKQAAEAEAKLAEKEKQAAETEAELAVMKKQAAEAAEKEKQAAMAVAKEETAPRKMVKIRIPRLKKDETDVFVSVNDYTCIVKRGVEVEVPDFVAEVLQHREEMLEIIMLSGSAGK